MTLYEIDSAIMDCVDEETGEIIEIRGVLPSDFEIVKE